MSKKEAEQDSDVYFLGTRESGGENKQSTRLYVILGTIIVAVVIIVALVVVSYNNRKNDQDNTESQTVKAVTEQVITNRVDDNNSKNIPPKGFIKVVEETVNDVPMLVYMPHQAEMSLTVGMPDKADSAIIFATQAADVRADNKGIVGDFVLAGEQLSRGVAKTGFCAVIKGDITIGAGDKTPLLSQAVENEGYFFRQYPLVSDGKVMENNPKNKSIRRALAIRNGKVIVVESRSQESFHDFAQALVDIGVSDAVYLVGSIAYGWYYDSDQQRHEFGIEQDSIPPSTSYIIWQTK